MPISAAPICNTWWSAWPSPKPWARAAAWISRALTIPRSGTDPIRKNLSQQFFDATVDNCRHVIDEIKPKRARFTIEAMGWSLPDGPDSYLKLIKAVDRPAFGVHLDVCNVINSPERFYRNSEVIADCFHKLGPWIVSCHAKDLAWIVELNVHFQEVIPGRGEIDYRTYLNELSQLAGGNAADAGAPEDGRGVRGRQALHPEGGRRDRSDIRMTRRDFRGRRRAAGAGGQQPPAHPQGRAVRDAAQSLSIADRFKLASDTGFEATECPTTPDQRTAEEIKKASESARLPIHSVMNMAHWKYPLSSADPGVVRRAQRHGDQPAQRPFLGRGNRAAGARRGQSADQLPGCLDALAAEDPHADSAGGRIEGHHRHRRSMEQVPAQPAGIAKYVDEFKSPWVRTYFDVGNVVLSGYPQDWIRTLGKRIAKLHIKDFRFRKMQAEFVPLREGEIDWPEVHKALGEIGYQGTATVELEGGDVAYLREVNRRFERFCRELSTRNVTCPGASASLTMAMQILVSRRRLFTLLPLFPAAKLLIAQQSAPAAPPPNQQSPTFTSDVST